VHDPEKAFNIPNVSIFYYLKKNMILSEDKKFYKISNFPTSKIGFVQVKILKESV
jgi:hypothetical protein